MQIGEKIYRELKRIHKIDLKSFIAPNIRNKNLFEFIIGVLLSQNTSDRNAIRAYNNLLKSLGSITPQKILSKSPDEIALLIKPAGMHFQRAKRILELARIFSDEEFVSELINKIKSLPVEESRKLLTKLPGVGEKTADVALLMYFDKPAFPIDTHIRRITLRLGVVESPSYEKISQWWMKELDKKHYLEAHLLLITHGRTVCKAKNPECRKCPIKQYCKYYASGNKK
ncbi:MAG: endonuclease III [Staphylothermus sp.]|nr:endonuclease III [Staphylothermus sp.]